MNRPDKEEMQEPMLSVLRPVESRVSMFFGHSWHKDQGHARPACIIMDRMATAKDRHCQDVESGRASGFRNL